MCRGFTERLQKKKMLKKLYKDQNKTHKVSVITRLKLWNSPSIERS